MSDATLNSPSPAHTEAAATPPADKRDRPRKKNWMIRASGIAVVVVVLLVVGYQLLMAMV